MKSTRVLALTKYGRLGASSRLRTLQYLPFLQDKGLSVSVQHMLDDDQLQSRYKQGSYDFGSVLRAYAQRVKALLDRHSFDLLWIEKEALQWWPLWAELALLKGVPYVLDYDDAVFHHYDMHHSAAVRRLFGRRLDGLMAKSRLVVAGNQYLAQRARSAGATRVEVLPTVIDLERYPTKPMIKQPYLDGLPRVVWIGSPSTAKYLQLISQPLEALARTTPFVLRVIGGGIVQIPGVVSEAMDWAENTEVQHLQSADVGIMPLKDSPWEQGKCGYKLIQYMACGLPVVASPVGVNSEIVQHRLNGFLASSVDEWVSSLEKLLKLASLRQTMGAESRLMVEAKYCIQKTGPKLAELLNEAAVCRYI